MPQGPAVLQSYVTGAWLSPEGDGRPVLDASTGEVVCLVSSDGIDAGAALAYGRSVGGPALRALTFHERAAMLKSLATHLHERREDLHELSARSGATRGDARFDVDGGIGALFAYASKARRELPNLPYYVEGQVETLGREGTFVGRHVCVPSHGVAVQINAFNFPVWGPLEKLAPALIAGVPSVIKPATQTAYLTARLVELIDESGILPAGALQMVCGGARDLLDHLEEQDLVSFTGSAATAQRLRSHPAVVRGSVRFNAEADSLNCSILGADAAPGTALFDLFVDQLVREMTVKAGQKCTAIRRALVPEAAAEAVVAAVTERLRGVTIGDPSDRAVRMGPLASLDQREELRRALDRLGAAGTLVFGGDEPDVVGADAAAGAFVAPTLMLCDDVRRDEPHEVEPFGPVSTVIPYRSTEEAIDLAARGRGSLAGSVVTGDTDLAAEIVLGLAPWHGRILVLNERNAGESTGHGSPLPALIHGGPGRAGGGEEMGGIRGVLHHMRRAAVQADPDILTAVTRQWTAGAATAAGVHPFRKHLDELRLGDTVVAGPRVVTQEDVEHFAEFTGDTFYAHMDEAAAAANPFFGGRVAHGYLVLSFAAGLFVDPDPGPVLANFGLDRLRFLAPTKFGDSLSVALTVKEITPRANADYGEVRWDATVTQQDGEVVATYELLTLVARRPSAG
jgi:oxepin-CoA hydrolase / 3-oxo-5,6-dehydrosuberyl-CoA semialdehyde dehydrogenase